MDIHSGGLVIMAIVQTHGSSYSYEYLVLVKRE